MKPLGGCQLQMSILFHGMSCLWLTSARTDVRHRFALAAYLSRDVWLSEQAIYWQRSVFWMGGYFCWTIGPSWLVGEGAFLNFLCYLYFNFMYIFWYHFCTLLAVPSHFNNLTWNISSPSQSMHLRYLLVYRRIPFSMLSRSSFAISVFASVISLAFCLHLTFSHMLPFQTSILCKSICFKKKTIDNRNFATRQASQCQTRLKINKLHDEFHWTDLPNWRRCRDQSVFRRRK